jgi:hypothetical protein
MAHGRHAATLLAEASRITGLDVEELPLVCVIDPHLEAPH